MPACEMNNGANILSVSVNGSESQRITLGVLGLETVAMRELSFSI